jgi:hypothetical protein
MRAFATAGKIGKICEGHVLLQAMLAQNLGLLTTLSFLTGGASHSWD